MPEFKVGDEVMLQGTVAKVEGASALVDTGKGRIWLRNEQLERIPAPVTVRCEQCGVERPLTDIKTARERCKALGIGEWGSASLHDFMELCTRLAENGVTAEQFNEGL